MMDTFNVGLTDGERERLALLAEEASEIVKAVCKILRHGYDSRDPTREGASNRTDLENEIGDLLGTVRMMLAARDIDGLSIEVAVDARLARVRRYLHFPQAVWPKAAGGGHGA